MYELIQLTERCYYIECPSKIGLIRLNEHDVCLIDSGNDKETGRKVRRILDNNAWNLKAIYNTHAHADHIGGNKYLHAQSQCALYAPTVNAFFARHPELEPSFLFGAYPPKDLRNKFLLAQESPTQDLQQEHLPQGLSIVPLPGHCFDMVGYASDDGVVYLADCLLSQGILDKYQVGVLYHVEQYLATLEQVKSLQAKFFVPSHSAVTEDIVPLAQYNIDKVHEIANKICEICQEPQFFEALLQKIFNHYALSMNFNQYVLVGTSIRSLLAWLKEQGRVQVIFENNMLLWHST